MQNTFDRLEVEITVISPHLKVYPLAFSLVIFKNDFGISVTSVIVAFNKAAREWAAFI